MKIKLSEILNSKDSIGKLLERELPIRISFRLTKLIKELDPELQIIEKHRIKLVEKYGKKNEENGNTEVSGDSVADFSKEFNTLLEEELDIDYEPIPISSLENISLSPFDVLRLEKFINQEM